MGDDDYQYNKTNQGFDSQTATNVKNHIRLVEVKIIQILTYKINYFN